MTSRGSEKSYWFLLSKNKMISRTQILLFFVSNVTFIVFSHKHDTIDQQLSQKKERDNLIYLDIYSIDIKGG